MFELKKKKHIVKLILKKLHLLLFFYKFKEWGKSISFSRNHTFYDYLPIPPPYLRVLVIGKKDINHFFSDGLERVFSMKKILKSNGLHFYNQEAILDFGCGCGRIIRFLYPYKSPLFGCDYNPKLIRWCKKNLSEIASFEVNDLIPSLPYSDQKFSLVYGISVFTHLPYYLQILWIKELSRIIKKEKHLILTYHGKGFLCQLSEKEKEDLEENKIVCRDAEGKGRNLCAVFHNIEWFENYFADYFFILDYKEGKKSGEQSMILFQRK